MKLYKFNELDSTNKYLKKNHNSYEEYDIISAKNQTHAKARRGNVWFSSEGMALFTFYINPKENFDVNEYLKLPLIAGVAVINGLKKIEPLDYKFKWTNDIYLNDRKLTGILLEKADDKYFVGIGININNILPNEVKNVAISLNSVTQKTYDIDEIILSIVTEFSELVKKLENGSWNEILSEINELNYLKDKQVTLKIDEKTVLGIAKNIDSDGRLEVLYDNEIHHFSIGEVLKERVVTVLTNENSSLENLERLKKLGYDPIGVYFFDSNNNQDDLQKIENFTFENKIKFEKVFMENGLKNEGENGNLFSEEFLEKIDFFCKKYRTNCISIEKKFTNEKLLNYVEMKGLKLYN